MHLIVGAGSIGTRTARLLADEGQHVRLVTRSGSGPRHANIELVAGHAADRGFLTDQAKGAEVIYNCANPQYHEWPVVWPPMHASMLAAAESSGAVLAITAPLYSYGPVTVPMTEDLPDAAPTVKGRVRAKMWADALAAHRAGRIRAVEVRASDFVSPKYSVLETAVPAMKAGKTVRAPMPLDNPHSFTWVGDVATLLTVVARDERAWGRVWNVPTPPPITPRELIERTARVGGYGTPKMSVYPMLAIRGVALYDKFVKEFLEMRYQFERPFVLDSSAATKMFGLEPTPTDEAIRATLAEM